MTSNGIMQDGREAVCDVGRALLEYDLTAGTGGNVSVRNGDSVAISPSGVPYREVSPDDVPIVDLAGTAIEEPYRPSSETPMHLASYRDRSEIGAVVHTHSPYATTFAALGRPIRAAHYLVAFGGIEVPVAEYATYGTEALGENAVEAMGTDLDACLLRNHGVLAVGADLDDALEVALNVEFAARILYQAESIGDPIILDDEEMESVRSRFQNYGQAPDEES